MCSCVVFVVFFFKQKTAYEMRISDWSSDVCSSDLISSVSATFWSIRRRETPSWASWRSSATPGAGGMPVTAASWRACIAAIRLSGLPSQILNRSEEHTSELQSLMRISYAVFCLKKKNKYKPQENYQNENDEYYHDLNRPHNTVTE